MTPTNITVLGPSCGVCCTTHLCVPTSAAPASLMSQPMSDCPAAAVASACSQTSPPLPAATVYCNELPRKVTRLLTLNTLVNGPDHAHQHAVPLPEATRTYKHESVREQTPFLTLNTQ